jgi:hypothetical protein
MIRSLPCRLVAPNRVPSSGAYRGDAAGFLAALARPFPPISTRHGGCGREQVYDPTTLGDFLYFPITLLVYTPFTLIERACRGPAGQYPSGVVQLQRCAGAGADDCGDDGGLRRHHRLALARGRAGAEQA